VQADITSETNYWCRQKVFVLSRRCKRRCGSLRRQGPATDLFQISPRASKNVNLRLSWLDRVYYHTAVERSGQWSPTTCALHGIVLPWCSCYALPGSPQQANPL